MEFMVVVSSLCQPDWLRDGQRAGKRFFPGVSVRAALEVISI